MTNCHKAIISYYWSIANSYVVTFRSCRCWEPHFVETLSFGTLLPMTKTSSYVAKALTRENLCYCSNCYLFLFCFIHWYWLIRYWNAEIGSDLSNNCWKTSGLEAKCVIFQVFIINIYLYPDNSKLLAYLSLLLSCTHRQVHVLALCIYSMYSMYLYLD